MLLLIVSNLLLTEKILKMKKRFLEKEKNFFFFSF